MSRLEPDSLDLGSSLSSVLDGDTIVRFSIIRRKFVNFIGWKVWWGSISTHMKLFVNLTNFSGVFLKSRALSSWTHQTKWTRIEFFFKMAHISIPFHCSPWKKTEALKPFQAFELSAKARAEYIIRASAGFTESLADSYVYITEKERCGT